MSTSAQLESETERTRADLAHTLDELRSRMTVGQVVDEVWHYAREGLGGDFARNLARQVANNPMPAALAGAGIAWMMFANTRRTPTPIYEPQRLRANGDGAYHEHVATAAREQSKQAHRVSQMVHNAESKFGDAASSATSTFKGAAESIGDKASAAYESVAEGASKAASAVTDKASQAYESVAETAAEAAAVVSEKAHTLAERTSVTAQRLTDYAIEHPLVLAGVGLAIGAAIGAALPVSETENRLFGEASDTVKRSTESLAAEQIQKAEAVGEKALDQASGFVDRALAPQQEAGARMPVDRMGSQPMPPENTRH